MAVVAMKQLLEAGVHFGHQTKRWDPKMAEYIYQARNGIQDRKSTRLNSSHVEEKSISRMPSSA